MQIQVTQTGVRSGARTPVDVPGGPRTVGLTERSVLRVGLALAAGFIVAALLAYAAAGTGGHWAGTHLALAGAALVAIGTFMPHFGVTLAGGRSEPATLRLAGIGALAVGGLLAVGGVLAAPGVAVAGAVVVWLGLGITAWATFNPARQPLARRHPIAQAAYGLALAEVAVGIGLAALYVGGFEPAVAAWARLKPAHVWLNLFGFVSLTITATLVYLYPTIVGARIRFHPFLAVMVLGAIGGPPLVALGAVAAVDAFAVVGGLLAVTGAAAQLAYVWEVRQRRGRWTTDLGWHRLGELHLAAGALWYLAATVTAAVGLLRDGVAPLGWSIGALAIPLVMGWTLQVLAGSTTHLLPAVALADPAGRTRARQLLGRASWARLVAWNAGVLAAWLGLGSGTLVMALAGIALLSLAALASALLVLIALRTGTRGGR